MVKPGGVPRSASRRRGRLISGPPVRRDLGGHRVPPVIVMLPMHQARMFIVGRQVSLGRVLASIPFEKLDRRPPPNRFVFPPTIGHSSTSVREHFRRAASVIITGLLLIAFIGSAGWCSAEELFQRGRVRRNTTLFLMGAAFLLIRNARRGRPVATFRLDKARQFIGLRRHSPHGLSRANLAGATLPAPEPAAVLLSALRCADRELFPPSGFAARPAPLAAGASSEASSTSLPVAFAGIIFSRSSVDRPTPRPLWDQMLGAVVGGCLEYLSIFSRTAIASAGRPR